MSLGLKYKLQRLWLIHTVAYYGAVKNYTADLFIDRERYPQNVEWKCRLENSVHCSHVCKYGSAYAWESVLKNIYTC